MWPSNVILNRLIDWTSFVEMLKNECVNPLGSVLQNILYKKVA